MDYDYYQHLRLFVYSVFGFFLLVYTYFRYRKHNLLKEYRQGNIIIALSMVPGSMNSYLSMYKIKSYWNLNTIHYADISLGLVILGGVVLLKGLLKDKKRLEEVPARKKGLKKLILFYVMLSVTLVAIRIIF